MFMFSHMNITSSLSHRRNLLVTVVSCHHQLSETAIDACSLGGRYHTLTDASLLSAVAVATISLLLSFCHQTYVWRDAGGSWGQARTSSKSKVLLLSPWGRQVSLTAVDGNRLSAAHQRSLQLRPSKESCILVTALVYRTLCTIPFPLSRRSTLCDDWPSPLCAGRRGQWTDHHY